MNVTIPIHHHALQFPRKPAVIASSDTLSYGRLDDLIWRGMGYFGEQGLKPGDRVGLVVPDPLLHLLAALSLSRLGVAYHAVAPAGGAGLLDPVLERIGACAVVAAIAMPGSARPHIPVTAARLTTATGRRPGEPAHGPDLPWRFVSTSGTTGRPKLFSLSHGNLLALMRRIEIAIPVSCNDVSMAMSGLDFLSATRRVFRDLVGGGTVVLAPSGGYEACVETMVRTRVNRAHAGPWAISHFLADSRHDAAFRRLTVLECGGSIVAERLRRQVLDRWTLGLQTIYGTNEITPIATALGNQSLTSPDTVGWPVPMGEVQIVDEDQKPLAVGQVGHIRIKDLQMVRRYWDDEAATRLAFRDGWFHPGDLGAWSETGEILFKGRADDMMIFDGINIYPSEIENCLMQHPDVVEAVAFGLGHERHGAVPVAAALVSRPAEPQALETFCRDRLGSRGPQRILILREFPRNARGKPIKGEMAKFFKFV